MDKKNVVVMTNSMPDSVGTAISADRVVTINLAQLSANLNDGMHPPRSIRQLAHLATTYSQNDDGDVTVHPPCTRNGSWTNNVAQLDDADVQAYVAAHERWAVHGLTSPLAVVPDSGAEDDALHDDASLLAATEAAEAAAEAAEAAVAEATHAPINDEAAAPRPASVDVPCSFFFFFFCGFFPHCFACGFGFPKITYTPN
jgi:hypothetical protein